MKEFFPEIFLDDYSYTLPKERIALYPLPDRSSSKLLIAKLKLEEPFRSSNYSDIIIEHKHFRDLPDLIPEDSMMIINNTKVIPARLLFKKSTGALVEIFCLEPVSPSTDPLISLNATEKCVWRCIYSGRKIVSNMKLTATNSSGTSKINALILKKSGREITVEFSWSPEVSSFLDIINQFGNIPLPPYIKRETEEKDSQTYQTIYASSEGSVASPTAGLHFTDTVLHNLRKKNINIENLTLHIGLGTFSPIESENVANHNMHSEIFSIHLGTIKNLLQFFKNRSNERLVAIGTTSMRTLETLYWMAVKIASGHKFKNDINEIVLNQYEPYYFQKTKKLPTSVEALETLIDYFEKESQNQMIFGKTELFIVPGYSFRIVDTLVTNFHLPGSTLILLVAAFVGRDNFHKIYNEALNNDYRFLSYGDSSILFR